MQMLNSEWLLMTLVLTVWFSSGLPYSWIWEYIVFHRVWETEASCLQWGSSQQDQGTSKYAIWLLADSCWLPPISCASFPESTNSLGNFSGCKKMRRWFMKNASHLRQSTWIIIILDLKNLQLRQLVSAFRWSSWVLVYPHNFFAADSMILNHFIPALNACWSVGPWNDEQEQGDEHGWER